MFCYKPAKNAVIYSIFFALPSDRHIGICSVLCISSLKIIGVYSIFCVFALFPRKKLKRKNAVIYTMLLFSESCTRCVKTALLFEFRYLQNGGVGGMLLETSLCDLKKAFPHMKDF